MSVLIKSMEMPKDKPIRIVLNPNGQLFVDHGVHFTEYEAVEIKPHGRLIDRDALLESIKEARKKDPDVEDVYIDDYFIMAEWLMSAPTIIEAEGGT